MNTINDAIFEPCNSDDFDMQKLRTIGSDFKLKLALAGVTHEEISRIRISLQPMFNHPVITTLPVHAAINDVQSYAYVRYLVENYAERNSSEWKLIQHHLNTLMTAPYISMGITASRSNQARASKSRHKKTDDGDSVTNIIKKLAAKKDAQGKFIKPSELWPEFFSALEDAQASPKENRNNSKPRVSFYTYESNGKCYPIRRSTFDNLILKFRKS